MKNNRLIKYALSFLQANVDEDNVADLQDCVSGEDELVQLIHQEVCRLESIQYAACVIVDGRLHSYTYHNDHAVLSSEIANNVQKIYNLEDKEKAEIVQQLTTFSEWEGPKLGNECVIYIGQLQDLEGFRIDQ